MQNLYLEEFESEMEDYNKLEDKYKLSILGVSANEDYYDEDFTEEIYKLNEDLDTVQCDLKKFQEDLFYDIEDEKEYLKKFNPKKLDDLYFNIYAEISNIEDYIKSLKKEAIKYG